MAPPRSSLAPIVTAGLIMIIWGATPVATRLAVADLQPLHVGLLRTVFAGVLALPIALALRQPLPKDRRGLLLLVISGVSGFIVFPLLYSFGQRDTSAMHGGMILAALPIFTGSYAALVERRRPTARWIAGCVIALLGECALIALRAGSGGAQPTLGGDLLVLLSALLVAAGYVAGARLAQTGYSSLATTLWGVALAAMVSAVIMGATVAGGGWPSAGWQSWSAVIYLASVTTIVGYIGWYWALAKGGIARISTIQFSQPVSGLILAALLLGERMTLSLLAASVVILAGVWIAQRR
ncbi:MAG TPA: DMT family transporter [Candidatus Angelobacter sp.]|nr:DMT family transporter [Candidatus Angelobacter sp.]